MTVQERVRRFVVDEIGSWEDPAALTDDLPLFDAGVLDSLGLFQLVELVEGEYGLRVADEDVHPGNFGTLATLADYVERRTAATAGHAV